MTEKMPFIRIQRPQTNTEHQVSMYCFAVLGHIPACLWTEIILSLQ